MDTDWTEKYRPASLSEVYGNTGAVERLKKWARAWQRGKPVKRAAILAGSPGVGKTSTALALAKDMGWGVIELNASDVRNAENIKKIAMRGALFETFTDTGEFVSSREGGKKLIILDEADNLYERTRGDEGKDRQGKDYSDKGGKSAIIHTIRATMQPIILIVNDLYALTKNSPLKKLCETIRFQKLRASEIEKALRRIVLAEGIEMELEALKIISERADGDLRAAINDLQAISRMGKRITVEMTEGMGFRDNVITLQDALIRIFTGTDAEVRKVTWELDETPDSLPSWVDENLPAAYTRTSDLVRGFDAISRADVYLGRVRRRQYYGLWAYASEMLSLGVAMAKQREYTRTPDIRFPGWILKMSRSKGMRQARTAISRKIADWCHTSINDARMELLPIFRVLFPQSAKRDYDFAVSMTDNLDLTLSEVAFLLNVSPEDEAVEEIVERAARRREERTGFHPSEMGTKKGLSSGIEMKKVRGKKAVEKKARGGEKAENIKGQGEKERIKGKEENESKSQNGGEKRKKGQGKGREKKKEERSEGGDEGKKAERPPEKAWF